MESASGTTRLSVRSRVLLTIAGAVMVSSFLPSISPRTGSMSAARGGSSAVGGNATGSATGTNAALEADARASVAPSFGVAPSIRVPGRLPKMYDPLTRVTSRIAGDRELEGVWLGPARSFPALGNDAGIDDCALVAVASITAVARLRLGGSAPHSTTTQAVAEWHELNANSSSGISDTTLLSAWAGRAGVLTTRISGWSSLDVTSERQIKAAITATGALYARLIIAPDASLTNLIWSRVPAPTDPVEEHAIALVGWTPSGWLAVTWGEVVLIPWSYWSAEGVSAYAVTLVPRS